MFKFVGGIQNVLIFGTFYIDVYMFPVKGVKAGDAIPGANLTIDLISSTPVKASPIISLSPGMEPQYNKAIQNICAGGDVEAEMIELQKAQETANSQN